MLQAQCSDVKTNKLVEKCKLFHIPYILKYTRNPLLVDQYKDTCLKNTCRTSDRFLYIGLHVFYIHTSGNLLTP